VFRFPDGLARACAKMIRDRERAQRSPRSRTRARCSTPRASRRSSSTTWSRWRALDDGLGRGAQGIRGAHDRSDFPERDDANWLKHTLWYKEGNRLEYKPVQAEAADGRAFEPKARVY
jgi:succinate dehydrogenase / fumarate reductase, flavoprotein subunit